VEQPVDLDFNNTGNYPVTCHFEYGPTPKLTLLNPSGGSVYGGTTVTICGSHLGSVSEVWFGTTPLTQINGSPSSPGQFEIVTQNYDASTSPYVYNNTPCGEINPVYPTSVTYLVATAPPGTGTVSVTAADQFGVSNALNFSYEPPPFISSISPTSFGETCWVHGNESFNIYGSNFNGATSVEIGGAAVRSPSGYTVDSNSEITVNINWTWTPSGQVTVITPSGSATSSQSISWNNSCL
jgi:hypothetical protein